MDLLSTPSSLASALTRMPFFSAKISLRLNPPYVCRSNHYSSSVPRRGGIISTSRRASQVVHQLTLVRGPGRRLEPPFRQGRGVGVLIDVVLAIGVAVRDE